MLKFINDIYYVMRTRNIFLKIIISKKTNIFVTILKLGSEKLKVNNNETINFYKYNYKYILFISKFILDILFSIFRIIEIRSR